MAKALLKTLEKKPRSNLRSKNLDKFESASGDASFEQGHFMARILGSGRFSYGVHRGRYCPQQLGSVQSGIEKGAKMGLWAHIASHFQHQKKSI